jgi:ABC-type phosphate transport system substrate-binding protein
MRKGVLKICSEHKSFIGIVLFMALAIALLLFFGKMSLPSLFMANDFLSEIELGKNNITGLSNDQLEKQIIRVGGSNAIYPIFKLLAEEFERRDPKYEVLLLPGRHSNAGAMGVINSESYTNSYYPGCSGLCGTPQGSS